MTNKILWHYTRGDNMRGILQDGTIKLATAGIMQNERPVVWFSTNPIWEETVNGIVIERDGTLKYLDKDETHAECGGLFRIGVAPETAPYTWEVIKVRARIKPKVAKVLAEIAREKGANPKDWRGTLEPVPREKWIAVESWNGSEWVSL